MESGVTASLVAFLVEFAAFVGVCVLLATGPEVTRRGRPRSAAVLLLALTWAAAISALVLPTSFIVYAPSRISDIHPLVAALLVSAVMMPIIASAIAWKRLGRIG